MIPLWRCCLENPMRLERDPENRLVEVFPIRFDSWLTWLNNLCLVIDWHQRGSLDFLRTRTSISILDSIIISHNIICVIFKPWRFQMWCSRASPRFSFVRIVVLKHDCWPMRGMYCSSGRGTSWEIVEVDADIHHLIIHALSSASSSRWVCLRLLTSYWIATRFAIYQGVCDVTWRRKFRWYLRELVDVHWDVGIAWKNTSWWMFMPWTLL